MGTHQNDECREHKGQRDTYSCSHMFPDGCMAEMALSADGMATSFLVSTPTGIQARDSIECRLGRIKPFSPSNSLLRHSVVCFPTGIEEFGSSDDLAGEIRAFIHRYADLSEAFEEIATYYILLTWVYDAFKELPYLRFKGDFGTGKSRCLLTIGSLCYKGMFASGASTVSPLFRIIDTFRGTLVMDEGDFRFSDERAELIKILNNGNAEGFPVLRSEVTPGKEFNPRAFIVYGPKVIATRNAFDDRALESRCITEVMTGLPPRPDIPLSLPAEFYADATLLRNKLLMYRFRNYGAMREQRVPMISGCEPRIAQVYAPLIAVVDNENGRQRVMKVARRASGVVRAERDATVEAQLLGIMYAMWCAHEPITVKAVTARFIETLGNEYTRPISPRWIGAQLRNRLSLTPVKSNGTFVLGPDSNARLRSLFERYGIGDVGDIGEVLGSA